MANASRTLWLPGFALAAVVILAVLVWLQQTELRELRDDYRRLAERNQSLSGELTHEPAQMRPAPQTKPTLPPNHPPVETPVPPSATQSPDAPAEPSSPTPHPPVATPNANASPFSLGNLTSKQTAEGLTAALQFKPDTTNAVQGELWIVVRVPADSAVRVLDIGPTDSTVYTNVGKRVSDDGKFSIFQGRPTTVNPVTIGVTLSGPVTVDVRGTHGIGRFNLQVNADGAKVVP